MPKNESEAEITLEKLLVSSLDPEQSPELVEILKKSELVVADIDYTFLDISDGHNQGIKNVARILGDDVAKRFNQIFHLMVEGHRRTED